MKENILPPYGFTMNGKQNCERDQTFFLFAFQWRCFPFWLEKDKMIINFYDQNGKWKALLLPFIISDNRRQGAFSSMCKLSFPRILCSLIFLPVFNNLQFITFHATLRLSLFEAISNLRKENLMLVDAGYLWLASILKFFLGNFYNVHISFFCSYFRICGKFW